ncbi:MAG TPA: TauD/TfdA family dioxygenase [Candidatus Sulfotelmatobacter sp.]|nr:TauD/TfdA family dioxygenase [Candidatus Sulfotelmatobacter sp.]
MSTAVLAIEPTGAALGAQVRGVDLARLDDASFAVIHDAWLRHQVLLVRDQHLSDAEFAAFSRRLGSLDEAPVLETGRRFVDGYPEIYVVSNILGDDGKPIGSLGAGEAAWHTDMSYLPMPPKASILYALEVPPAGGDTSFCSMYAAYDELSPALRELVRGRTIKHDGTYTSAGDVRLGVAATDDPRRSPGASHPVICTHPETGRPVLYLGRRRNAYIDDLSVDESEALLDALWANATAHAWRHRWRVGDVVLWDNRCTMHRREPFDANARRLLRRTQISGTTRPAA